MNEKKERLFSGDKFRDLELSAQMVTMSIFKYYKLLFIKQPSFTEKNPCMRLVQINHVIWTYLSILPQPVPNVVKYVFYVLTHGLKMAES